ncbi:hypothetical protein BDV29DRAFT_193889 [Aspergillus leporis]|uniref:Uncharacterized protein n=1 Tax=Aspergillus leporis TaxID=41062 RepID=A0A5N5WQQ7_9EURO|nr:hypothetical protein BDV29DRAFT_193889 [Aspergillus leporis]
MLNKSCFVPSSSGVAFVTGANGISGQAIIDHLIRLPKSKWPQIIITSRKKIKVVCKDVTRAFFTSYVHNKDFNKLHEKNGPLFRNFLESLDMSSPKLKRHCGFQFRDNTSLLEEMPRCEGPESIFFYEQEDDLVAIHAPYYLSRADFGINEAIPIAQYFLICREIGEIPKWPGPWQATIALRGCPMLPAQGKRPVWESIVAKYVGGTEAFRIDSFALMNWYITPSVQKVPFISTVAKARKFSWNHIDESYESWINIFRSYENAGILPVQEHSLPF